MKSAAQLLYEEFMKAQDHFMNYIDSWNELEENERQVWEFLVTQLEEYHGLSM